MLRSTSHLPLSWRKRGTAGVDWTWAFTLHRTSRGSRLVFRWRAVTTPGWLTALTQLIVVPADAVMSRGMLHGIRDRVIRQPQVGDIPMTLAPGPAVARHRMTVVRRWIAGLEVVLAAAVIALDVAIPTLVVLLLVGASLAMRRQSFASLGFRRLASPLRTSLVVLLLTCVWSVLLLGLVMPLANRLTGTRQDLTAFADLKGNGGLLLGLLLASWTLAALGEETVYRGYLPTRVQEALRGGADRLAWPAVVIPAGFLFASAHLEQGVVGVLVTFLDALFFTWMRVRRGRPCWPTASTTLWG